LFFFIELYTVPLLFIFISISQLISEDFLQNELNCVDLA